MEGDESLDNIFEEYESRENDGETNGIEMNQESNNETSTGVRVQPTKRIVKNPRLKFNPERLCGERGIPILMDHFKDVKFKGKGHEKEDLDKLLMKLEHWTHRLFPSMKFEDCLHHIEKLGKKRPVQTCVRKIRLDMPILATDFVKDNEEDDVQRNEDKDSEEIDAFDKLVGENQNFNSLNAVDQEVDSAFSALSPPSQRESTSALGGQVLGSAGSSLTEEQKERLERNRMLAIERRKARLVSAQQNTAESVPESNEKISEDPIILPSDSPNKSKMIIPDNLLANTSHSHNNENFDSSELRNQNSDNLGLDDLIDLVDKEVNFDKIANLSSEQSAKICIDTTEELLQSNMASNLKETVSCRVLDNNNSNMTTTSNTLGFTEDKNLKLDSLIDLINDNSEENQQNSDLLETVKYDDSDSKNLISGEKMSTAMDCEDEKLSNEFGPDNSSLVIVEDPLMEIL